MLMQKIRDNAAWVVLVAVVCFVALIFVDWGMSPGNSMTQKTIVGEVEGESIRYEELDRYVQQQATQATQGGRELSAEDYARMRRQIFDELVRLRIVTKVFETYQLKGSPEQVLDYLRRNPPPGAEKAPLFMGPDSQFSRSRYEKWLADPRIYEDPYMRMMEQEVSSLRLPEAQLQKLLQAGTYATSLEVAFRQRRDTFRAWGASVVAPEDSFLVPLASDADVKAYFDAHPDSFFVPKDIAKIPYVFLPRGASRKDSLDVRDFADTLLARIQAGESFDTLARDYSEDPGSAANFGSLGSPQPRTTWVPVFSNTVATLQPGQVSAPVQSSFGWHLIKLKGRTVEGADTLYDVSHILLRVTPSPDALEEIKGRLDSIASKVKAGTAFAEAVAAAKLSIDTARVLKGDIANAGNKGAVVGLSGWAFRGQKEEKVSEVLDNEAGFFLAGPARILKAGRDLETSSGRIRNSIMAKQRRDKAMAYVNSKLPAITACGIDTACLTALGKLVPQALVERPTESFLVGYGFATPELYASWFEASAKLRTWTKPIATVSGVAMLRLDSFVVADSAKIAAEARNATVLKAARDRRLSSAYPEWYGGVRKQVKIEDNLDRFYRD